MKKQLLLATVLLTATTGVLAQAKRTFLSPELMESIAAKYASKPESPVKYTAPKTKAGPKHQAGSKTSINTFNWNRVTWSMNAYGVLLAESKAVTYDEDLGAVCLILRRGPGYTPTPMPNQTGAQTGGIVAFVSTNWGATWDSTLLWSDEDHWARYPQGGIWNPQGPPKNTQLSNAQAVAMGPCTNVSEVWEGNFLANKKLDAFTTTVSAVLNSTIFAGGIAPNIDTNVRKVAFLRQDFQATDDGLIRALGRIDNDVMANPSGYRGSRIVKGSYSNGAFVWVGDSVVLNPSYVDYDPGSLSYNVIDGLSNMAWSEDGQIGYCWFSGVRKNNTGHNKGFQPIVWTTTNGGSSWSLIPGINFNDTVKFAPVLNRLDRVDPLLTSAAEKYLRIPFFNFRETMGSIVDKNGNLHLATDVLSTEYGNADSVGFIKTYVVGTQEYYHKYTGGNQPMIFDFTFNRNTSDWNVIIVDSLKSEAPNGAPGTSPSTNGYDFNPWNVFSNQKQNCDNRLQISRTPDGQYIVYTWAESNPLFTPQGVRWNVKPNLYARMRNVDSTKVHADKLKLTENSPDPESMIVGNTFFHTTSMKMKGDVTNPYNLTFTVPIRFTSSPASPVLNANDPNFHYFSAAVMSFTLLDVGIEELSPLTANDVVLFPNPANDHVQVNIRMDGRSDLEVSVLNLVGQEVHKQHVTASQGETTVDVYVSNLPAGVYLVNLRSGSAVICKKLIIE